MGEPNVGDPFGFVGGHVDLGDEAIVPSRFCVDESLARSIGHREREVATVVAAAGDHVRISIEAVEPGKQTVAAAVALTLDEL